MPCNMCMHSAAYTQTEHCGHMWPSTCRHAWPSQGYPEAMTKIGERGPAAACEWPHLHVKGPTCFARGHAPALAAGCLAARLQLGQSGQPFEAKDFVMDSIRSGRIRKRPGRDFSKVTEVVVDVVECRKVVVVGEAKRSGRARARVTVLVTGRKDPETGVGPAHRRGGVHT